MLICKPNKYNNFLDRFKIYLFQIFILQKTKKKIWILKQISTIDFSMLFIDTYVT